MKVADTREEIKKGRSVKADGWDCGQVRTCLGEKARDRYVRRDAFASLILLYFAAVSIYFCPWFFHPLLCSSFSSPSVPPGYPPSHHLSSTSMYIFRSRVIKPAPEGMCLNRISLILPCPHCATKHKYTKMHACL